jgi:ferric-dicitrate binding protein FerR (iron transport regulator)
MALNTFKTRTAVLTMSDAEIYVAPANYTSIIIMAQVSNVADTAVSVTVSHRAGATNTQLVQGFSIPVNDSASVITGKLVLEAGQSVRASASAESSAKIILSILETLNG